MYARKVAVESASWEQYHISLSALRLVREANLRQRPFIGGKSLAERGRLLSELAKINSAIYTVLAGKHSPAPKFSVLLLSWGL